MFPSPACRPALAVAAALCLAWPAAAQPLLLEDALQIAERDAPRLAMARADIAATSSEALPAGALPNPRLIAGLDNFPVTGAERGLFDRDFMTMQRIGVMQEVPSAAKRRAAVAQAEAEVAVSRAGLGVARQQLRRETATAWLSLWSLERRNGVFAALEHENQLLAMTITAQVASGRAEPADALAPAQEAAQLADRRDALRRDSAKARAGLRRLVGESAGLPLPEQAPEFAVDPSQLHEHLAVHPEVEAFTAQTRRAEAALAEAEARKSSDWSVEVAYQRRGGQFGDMVSLQFNFELPIGSDQRNDPVIAARRLAEERVASEREALVRDHAQELDSDVAEWTALTSQLERARGQAVPLAQQKVDLLLAGYAAGRVRLVEVLAARRDLLDQRLRVLELDGERRVVAARLHFAYGEEQP
ncbi:MAG: TolC family protein [Pseudomonadota bacterium]|nr:TolC family protein [Pseudomonadota bacterium]